jgi:mRNA-degrading endonuclease RelE of RelBE toxin-antitoxin system
MSFRFVVSDDLKKVFDKIGRKDKVLAINISKKIKQIISSDHSFVEHLKNLKGGLKNYKRVHIGSFVLMFKIENDVIIFDKFEHHDSAYK